jgi:hypothetical protein
MRESKDTLTETNQHSQKGEKRRPEMAKRSKIDLSKVKTQPVKDAEGNEIPMAVEYAGLATDEKVRTAQVTKLRNAANKAAQDAGQDFPSVLTSGEQAFCVGTQEAEAAVKAAHPIAGRGRKRDETAIALVTFS